MKYCLACIIDGNAKPKTVREELKEIELEEAEDLYFDEPYEEWEWIIS